VAPRHTGAGLAILAIATTTDISITIVAERDHVGGPDRVGKRDDGEGVRGGEAAEGAAAAD
jgi:hypothetical protein